MHEKEKTLSENARNAKNASDATTVFERIGGGTIEVNGSVKMPDIK